MRLLPLVCACLLVDLVSSGAAGQTVAERLAARSFPSVFQAWSPADNLKGEDELKTIARHDLVFHGAGFFGLQWNNSFEGLADGFTPDSIIEAREKRETLLKKNPAIIMLAEIRYRDADRTFLPKDHAWWRRAADGSSKPAGMRAATSSSIIPMPPFAITSPFRPARRSGVVWWMACCSTGGTTTKTVFP